MRTQGEGYQCPQISVIVDDAEYVETSPLVFIKRNNMISKHLVGQDNIWTQNVCFFILFAVLQMSHSNTVFIHQSTYKTGAT